MLKGRDGDNPGSAVNPSYFFHAYAWNSRLCARASPAICCLQAALLTQVSTFKAVHPATNASQ